MNYEMMQLGSPHEDSRIGNCPVCNRPGLMLMKDEGDDHWRLTVIHNDDGVPHVRRCTVVPVAGWLTPAQFASLAGVERSTVYAQVRKGRIAAERPYGSQSIMIRPASLAAYLSVRRGWKRGAARKTDIEQSNEPLDH